MDINLKGTIKTVKTLDKGLSYGETEFLSNNGFVVRVALDKNKKVDEFCGTLLHELLHVWFKIVKKVGRIKLTDSQEHNIIKGIENVVMYFTFLHLSQRK